VSSCILFHGPGARNAALVASQTLGRLVAPPLGDDGLGVEDAREVVGLLLSTPVGSRKGVLIVGPMDRAGVKAADVLLKRLEEFPEDIVQPLLWAHDLGGVPPTIRSRCLDRWAPGEVSTEDNEAVTNAAWGLIDAALTGDMKEVAGLVRNCAGQEILLLDTLVECLATDLADPNRMAVWGRLRSVAQWKNPAITEIVAALLG
jgi:hypothetical protein